MADTLKHGFILFLVTVIAAVCLGAVYDITAKPIEDQRIKTEQLAMSAVLPEANEFKSDIDIASKGPVSSVKTGYNGSDIVGYIFFVSPKGYAGPVDMIVAVKTDGVISGVNIIKNSETPGLGANAAKPEFQKQYAGKRNQIKVTKTAPAKDDEVLAITSATITSNAVTQGVNDALTFFNTYIQKEGAK